jgi:hypothetical protein
VRSPTPRSPPEPLTATSDSDIAAPESDALQNLLDAVTMPSENWGEGARTFRDKRAPCGAGR